MRYVIGIIDKKANDFVGPPWLYRHEAQAIRQYGDLAQDQNTLIYRHPEDYDVVQLGVIDDDSLEITPGYRVIMTGEQYLATRTPQEKPT